MPLLKEPVATLQFPLGQNETFLRMTRQLRTLGLDVEKESLETGEIVVRCLSECLNMLLWRCWSDRLLLQVQQGPGGGTIVSISVVPNLRRIRVRSDEHLLVLSDVVSALQQAGSVGQ
jgi:hypothetical protein